MKSNSIEIPSVLLNLGDGNWHYNYNIKETTKEEDGAETKQYDYDTVFIAGNPTVAKIVNAVVHEHHTDDDIALMNAQHQAALLGLDEDPQGYSTYLALVAKTRADATIAMSDFVSEQ